MEASQGSHRTKQPFLTDQINQPSQSGLKILRYVIGYGRHHNSHSCGLLFDAGEAITWYRSLGRVHSTRPDPHRTSVQSTNGIRTISDSRRAHPGFCGSPTASPLT